MGGRESEVGCESGRKGERRKGEPGIKALRGWERNGESSEGKEWLLHQ
jgi:hypothetical protein